MSANARADSPKHGPTTTPLSNRSISNKQGKEIQMLALFAAGTTLNRFQAERYGDHCLPTTISDLQKRFDLEFSRQREKVNTRFDRKTIATRYWLEGEHLIKAKLIVRRGAA